MDLVAALFTEHIDFRQIPGPRPGSTSPASTSRCRSRRFPTVVDPHLVVLVRCAPEHHGTGILLVEFRRPGRRGRRRRGGAQPPGVLGRARASSATGWCGPSSRSTSRGRSRPTCTSTASPTTLVVPLTAVQSAVAGAPRRAARLAGPGRRRPAGPAAAVAVPRLAAAPRARGAVRRSIDDAHENWVPEGVEPAPEADDADPRTRSTGRSSASDDGEAYEAGPARIVLDRRGGRPSGHRPGRPPVARVGPPPAAARCATRSARSAATPGAESSRPRPYRGGRGSRVLSPVERSPRSRTDVGGATAGDRSQATSATAPAAGETAAVAAAGSRARRAGCPARTRARSSAWRSSVRTLRSLALKTKSKTPPTNGIRPTSASTPATITMRATVHPPGAEQDARG